MLCHVAGTSHSVIPCLGRLCSRRHIVSFLSMPSSQDNKVCVQSEGVNFPAVWAMSDVFDVRKIVSNDIAAILAYVLEPRVVLPFC